MQLTFPAWYDDFAEFEQESKGFLEGVSLSHHDKTYILNFYDQSRLQQDIDEAIADRGCWIYSNLVVVPTVTRSAMEEVVNGLSESDLKQLTCFDIEP
jgi:hypothetical protein